MWPTKEKYAQTGAFSTSFGTHDEISQVPTVPTDASNATILELSVRMIPHSGALVRRNLIFFTVKTRILPSLLRGTAQIAPLPYTVGQEPNLTRNFYELSTLGFLTQ